MSRNNSTRKILVTSGDAALLAAGGVVDDLGVGQLGVFDANTGLSVDQTSDSVREFFLAVGLDRDGDATQDDINVSAGQYIQRSGVVTYNFREHTAARPMILKVANYLAECGQTYGIRLEFRNQQIYRTQGFNQFTKIFTTKTDDCDGCQDCPKGDANQITLDLVNEINLDKDQLVTAKAVTRQAVTIATHGVVADLAVGADITDADIQALITFNETAADTDKVFTDMILTSNNLQVRNYCDVNLLYFHPRGNFVIASLVDGFKSRAVVTQEQELAFEEGSGYDIAQKEYHAAGDAQNKPYVVSDTTGVPISYDQFADRTEKYDQFVLEYDFTSQMEGTPYLNQLSTIVAIPNDSTTTRDSFAAVMDAQLGTPVTGFDALADDVATADTDDTVVSSTEDQTEDTDGQA